MAALGLFLHLLRSLSWLHHEAGYVQAKAKVARLNVTTPLLGLEKELM